MEEEQQHQLMHATTTTPLPLLLVLLSIPLVLLLLLQRISRRRRPTSSSSSSNHHHGSKQQQEEEEEASSKDSKKKKNPRRGLVVLPPSPPGGLPVIGHLHLIGDRPHVSLRDLGAKHGGLILLRLGAVPTVVATSPRAAQAILRTHDHVFASRPASTLSDTLLYGSSDIGFAPYGEHWRQLRKLVTTRLFTVKKVQSYRVARQQEVQLVMAKIRREAAAAAPAATATRSATTTSVVVVDLSETMNAFANDIVCRAVSGKFFRAEGRNRLFRELIEMNSRLFGGFSLLEDYFPGLARSPVLRWFVRSKARKGHRRWDDLLEKIITDHEQSRSSDAPACDGALSSSAEQLQEEGDFIDVLLSVQHDYGITRDHIKAILMDMFGAGTDTSSLVLELAMAELMRNPDTMTKLQAEVRSNTPEGQELVLEENLGSMSYLKAVVKETLRLHPPAPLLIPHLAMADCDDVLDGYAVPAGTRVIVNAWAVGRDPEAWKEKPEEFVPERFVVVDDGGGAGSAAGVDFRGNDFQFLPFGAGRRICPGLNFGLATVEIMLANLVYCVDWALPDGMRKEDIDTTAEVFGLTVHPKQKLVLVPKPARI